MLHVSNTAELAAAISQALAGDHIVLADGQYGNFAIAAKGTRERPIVVKAANILKASAGRVEVSGAYIWICGLLFRQTTCAVTGDYNRVTRNFFDGGPPGVAMTVSIEDGSFNRVDHNELANIRGRGISVVYHSSLTARGNLVDRNYLHDWKSPNENTHEAIQVGGWPTNEDKDPRYAIVEYNLFDKVCNKGEPEAICAKSSHNLIRYNTLLNSPHSGISLRHGLFNVVRDNFMSGCVGIIAMGDHYKILGNALGSGKITLRAGNGIMSEYKKGCYPACRHTVVAGNKAAEILVGSRYSDRETMHASNNRLEANDATITRQFETNTAIIPASSENVGNAAALKPLTPDDVGIYAPDVKTTPLPEDWNLAPSN